MEEEKGKKERRGVKKRREGWTRGKKRNINLLCLFLTISYFENKYYFKGTLSFQ